ncbi:TPA: hypothetical protein EYP37_13665, partial [Candidatus Poribacteria bacterium]|nr:hypothetical protein [Candidatus Poribacteria bacterium]
MSKRIGIGIIGCGMISKSHVRGYLELPERARILAVCDVVEENAKERAAMVISEAEERSHKLAEEAKKAETAEEKGRLEERSKLLAEYAK